MSLLWSPGDASMCSSIFLVGVWFLPWRRDRACLYTAHACTCDRPWKAVRRTHMCAVRIPVISHYRKEETSMSELRSKWNFIKQFYWKQNGMFGTMYNGMQWEWFHLNSCENMDYMLGIWLAIFGFSKYEGHFFGDWNLVQIWLGRSGLWVFFNDIEYSALCIF